MNFTIFLIIISTAALYLNLYNLARSIVDKEYNERFKTVEDLHHLNLDTMVKLERHIAAVKSFEQMDLYRRDDDNGVYYLVQKGEK